MYGIIYIAINKIDGKVYVGQTKQTVKTRFGQHCNEALREEKLELACCYFHQALLRYGKENFIVEQIDTAETKEELDEKESHWIKVYNSTDRIHGYNLTPGGDGGTSKGHIWINNGVKNKYLKSN